MQQIADQWIRSHTDRTGELPSIDRGVRDVRGVRWRLWHGRVDRAIRDLERVLVKLKHSQREGEFSIARLHSLGLQLLTYVRSNRGAIVNYGKRYRAGLREATSLAESAVNSLVGKRMVKKQQMRTAEINGELHQRLRAPFDSQSQTCLLFSSLNLPFCAPPDPREITGVSIIRCFLRAN
ncbi:hypothetical protein [Mesorhizobium sp. L48C026A00]|uniref:hypothetical protein n=1 Tax=Mesorhizobium sp. L48C026A00 TaxID=1287182 RepID=UPI0003D03CFE|nr:hypothetical protein [Mesorhizobium sp. L48C026A00]ESZ02024.1 hypothetical protein X737_38665 [Mesorhizobium sp. L48C026A00]